MSRLHQEKRECPIKPIDLRSISRDSDKCEALIILDWDFQNRPTWIKTGAVSYREDGLKQGELKVRMKAGLTDFEHDSAYILCLPIVGFRLESIDNHVFHYLAWINVQDLDDFRVPEIGHDPMEGAYPCPSCKGEDAHMIVQNFTPKPNPELGSLVRGKRIEIYMGPKFDEE